MKLLIIEDQFELADIYRKYLSQNQIIADIALDASQALSKLKINTYDFILLDLNLPDMFGIELLKKIDKKIPIIIITAIDDNNLVVEGLDNGADDFLIKPINYPELIARIHAVYRRKKETLKTKITIDNLTIDFSKKIVSIDNSQLNLSLKEFEILSLLVKKHPGYVTKKELINNLYDEYFDENSSVLRVHIYNLKNKLKNIYQKNVIISEKNMGYKLCLNQ